MLTLPGGDQRWAAQSNPEHGLGLGILCRHRPYHRRRLLRGLRIELPVLAGRRAPGRHPRSNRAHGHPGHHDLCHDRSCRKRRL